MDLADDIRAQKEICAAKQSEWDDNLTPSNPKENTDEVAYFYLYVYLYIYIFILLSMFLEIRPLAALYPPYSFTFHIH